MARATEAAGLTGFFRTDHYLSLVGRPDRGSLDAWSVLAALSRETDRVRLGTLVSPVTFRHPSELAKIAATLDHLSGGRIEVGLGTGYNDREHAAYGFPFPGLGTRMELLQEQLEIIRRSWAEAEFSFAGRHYAVDNLPALPKPLQPRLPSILGGTAGPRGAALAARFADEYNHGLAPKDELLAARARVVEACERAGRDPAEVRWSVLAMVAVAAGEAQLLKRVRHGLTERFPDESAESLVHGPPQRVILGTATRVQERVGSLAELGVERLYLWVLGNDDGVVQMLEQDLLPGLVT
jgi:alkanesulfonate monooxygenase SsuD/methylene tetrahydromethanopterin reductase-like flavin-dependent oxidoreductase (luciferase family)